MSGAKRKGGYRKGVVDDYLNSYPEPEENERIALVCGSRGNNIFEISLSFNLLPSSIPGNPPAPLSSATTTSTSATQESTQNHSLPISEISSSSSYTFSSSVELAILPNKFKNLIWVKRGDYVIVSSGDDSASKFGEDATSRSGKKEKGDKVKFFIKCILNRDQIKHLKAIKKWPQQEDDSSSAAPIASHNVEGVYSDDLMPGYEMTQGDFECSEEYGEGEDADEEFPQASTIFSSLGVTDSSSSVRSDDNGGSDS